MRTDATEEDGTLVLVVGDARVRAPRDLGGEHRVIVAQLGAALAAAHPGRLHLIEGRFGDMLALLAARGVTELDGVVLDLGVSSFQLDEPERGFSVRADGPLDMRMDPTRGPTAAELLAGYGDDWRSLAALLRELGEEPQAWRVARAILAGMRRYFEEYAPPGPLLAARRHVIGQGDSLAAVAARYQVTPDALRAANGLLSESLPVGKVLRIPADRGS